MMNKVNYIIATTVMFSMALASDYSAIAQNLPDGVYLTEQGLAYRKTATLVSGTTDRYKIELEAFVTGDVTVSNEAVPADIVLVLDVSGSMADEMFRDEYTARSSQGYSYNSYGNNAYYYKHTDDNYYRVTRGSYQTGGFLGIGATNHYYLTFSANGTTYYLFGNSVTTQRPSTPSSQWNDSAAGTTIWTGVLYTYQQISLGTKLANLKTAVGQFIDVIHTNDLYEIERDEQGHEISRTRRKDKDGHDTSLGNQIAIVKYARARYTNGSTTWNAANAPITVSGTGINYYQSQNLTEVVRGFTFTDTETRITDLKNAVNSFTAAGATASDFGMHLAYRLLGSLPTSGTNDRSGSVKTVVFFTDGSPTYQSAFQDAVATNTISRAYNAKNEYSAKVFTVGVFDDDDDNVDKYMNYTSSNYPEARSMSQPNNPIPAPQRVYYQNASGADLTSIFTTIAHASAGSGNTDVTAESSVVVDVIASSFALPENVKEEDITVQVAKCNGQREIEYNGETKTYLTFETARDPSQYGLPAITPHVDADNNKVSTTGFDFSSNYCWYDDTQNPGVGHGYKQIISFEITTADNVVGGLNVATNDRESGIYLKGSDRPLVRFNRPTVELPISI